MSAPIALVVKPTVEQEIQQAAIEILEKALAEAREGRVYEALVILRRPDGNWVDERSGATNFPDSIGRLEIVKQSWIKSYLDGCQ